MIDESKVRSAVALELALIAPLLTVIDEMIRLAPPCSKVSELAKANDRVRQRMRAMPDALVAMGPFGDRMELKIATQAALTPVIAALDEAMALCKSETVNW